MNNNQLIWGIVISILGFALIITSIFTILFLLIYGIPLFIIGIVIILNKNEDKIEQREDLNKKKNNKKNGK